MTLKAKKKKTDNSSNSKKINKLDSIVDRRKRIAKKLKNFLELSYRLAKGLVRNFKPLSITLYKYSKIKVIELYNRYEPVVRPKLQPLIDFLYPYYTKVKNFLHFYWAKFESNPNHEFIRNILFAKTMKDSGYESKDTATVSDAIRPYIRFFGYLMAGFVFFFFIWGGLAPLDEASIAQGTIVVMGNRKVVQHEHGGVIVSIDVEDGQVVKEGDVLMVIDDTNYRNEVARINNLLTLQKAVRQRIIAEQQELPQIDWNTGDFDMTDTDVQRIVETQNHLFKTKVAMYEGSRKLKLDQIQLHRDKIVGLESRISALDSIIASMKEEITSYELLLEKGLLPKNKLFEMQRRLDELLANRVQVQSEIANELQTIGLNELEVFNIENEYQTKLAEEYRQNHEQILDLTEKLNTQRYAVERAVIKAPTSGVVTSLAFHTVGGVVGQGAKILEIVPSDYKLVVEAQIRPQDIDSVHVGLLARVQLGAFKQRIVPRLDGTVIYVSADATPDDRQSQQMAQGTNGAQQQGGAHYIARVQIDEKQLEEVNADIKLAPGMPATVFIVKGERTFLHYMISPILDSFHRAFKER